MSNRLAIATVSATLSQLVNTAATAAVSGATVRFGQPIAPPAEPAPEVNISLYRVTPNVAGRNRDVPTRLSDGRLISQPTLALDLHYILSFYGDEAELQPQLMLGSVLQALHVQPVLTKSMISAAISANTFLSTSDLDEEPIEQVKFMLETLSVDELTKVWSSLYHTIPYSLSVMYLASVVLVVAEEELELIPEVSEINLNLLLNYLPPVHQATGIAFTDTNETSDELSGDITITRAVTEIDITHYALYWGANVSGKLVGDWSDGLYSGVSASSKLLGYPPIAVLTKATDPLAHTLTAEAIPPGATHLLVFTRQGSTEMEKGMALRIVDNQGT